MQKTGVTVSQIREYLYAKLPHLKEYAVSITANKQMFEAPSNSLKANVGYNKLLNSIAVENITWMHITFSLKIKCD